MIKRKHAHITLLLGLFFFTLTNIAQQGPSLTDEIKKHTIKQTSIVIGNQVIDFCNYLKEKNGIVSPLHKKQQEHLDIQVQTAGEDLKLKEKQASLQDKQGIHIDEQIKGQEYDNLLKLKAILNTLDPNSEEYAAVSEQIKSIIQKISGKPSTTKEDGKKTEPAKKEEEKPKGDGFFKTLATYSLFVATAAGEMADSIADYSFEYITGLEQLKDTVIGKHKKNINRALVGITLCTILYKSYSLYKAYQAEKNITEDDIFNDDDED